MSQRWLLSFLLLCSVLTATTARGQNLCPPGVKSDKLICLIPQVYGVNGLVLTSSSTEFQTSFLASNLKPLNSALARQSVLLPIPSPSSGIVYSWSPTGELTPSAGSLGPIFSERADTIGKSHVFLGLAYQYFSFSGLDGVDLKSLPVVFTQPDVTIDFGPTLGTKTCSLSSDSSSTGLCSVIRDVIKSDNRVDLKIHEIDTSITYGLTNNIDISVIIPIENVRMGITANATIVNNSNSQVHSFQVVKGVCDFPCRTHSFSNSGTASGIGDIIVRVKGVVWKGDRAGLGLGADVRLSTGDSLNFIGAGAYGATPFVVWSYRSRFSPHLVVGYEVNGSSQIAGDISTGTKERLPGQLTYSTGADVWLSARLTAALDFIGQQVFQGRRTSLASFTEPGACTQDFGTCAAPFNAPNVDANLAQSTGTFNVTNLSIGVKVRPFGNSQQLAANRPFSSFVITANVLAKLNNGGLRGNAVPLFGVSYTF